MSSESKQALRRQKKKFIVLLLAVIFGVIILVCLNLRSSKPIPIPSKPKSIDLPGDKVSPQEIFMKRLESDNERLDQKLSYLETIVLESKKKEEGVDRENILLRQQITQLKQDLRTTQLTAHQTRPSSDTDDEPFATSGQSTPTPLNRRAPLQELVMAKPKIAFSHVDHAIPAGTTVKALLVSSVDAPCGVLSSSNPHPVKLRILDHGHLPKSVTARLKGGIIIGGAHGDISSERVYVRIERLTQLNPQGEFVETDVTGFVTGEDGRYGVRGVVVDKSKKMVTGAAFSGFFSGISRGVQSAFSFPGLQGIGSSTPDAMHWSLLKQGSLSGSTSAMDKLADYYIQRAEQIQPVLQVAAGRVVDITFTHGAEIGDLHTKEKVEQIREQARRQS